AAVDIFLNPGGYLPLVTRHSLREILDRLLIVVHASARKLTTSFGPDIVRRKNYRRALIETSIVTNAALAAYPLREWIGIMGHSPLQAVYGIYLLETREVWTPRLDKPDGARLAPAPRDLAEFETLGEAMVKSPLLTTLLAAEP